MKLVIFDADQLVQSNLPDECFGRAISAVMPQIPREVTLAKSEQTDEFRLKQIVQKHLLHQLTDQERHEIQSYCIDYMRQDMMLNPIQRQVNKINVKSVIDSFDNPNLNIVLISRNWPAITSLLMPSTHLNLGYMPFIHAIDVNNVQALLPCAIQKAQEYYECQFYAEVELVSTNTLLVKTAKMMGWKTNQPMSIQAIA
ncbi:MAG: hypothetical protein HRU38_03580 [Saccharospirillaceae bacterium]|nr:hypothetical protein [Pseudomonadales bacterium]NRB77744.1 hypothetical protein [Saccharospirillaceae bacterium]